MTPVITKPKAVVGAKRSHDAPKLPVESKSDPVPVRKKRRDTAQVPVVIFSCIIPRSELRYPTKRLSCELGPRKAAAAQKGQAQRRYIIFNARNNPDPNSDPNPTTL